MDVSWETQHHAIMANTNGSRKRRRETVSRSQTNHGDAADAKNQHELFIDYARSRGVIIGSVKPAALPGRGIGLVATAPIKKDERIMTVPEKAMFKPNAALFKSEDRNHRASPQAQLAYSLAAALATPDSSLEVWKATWPTLENFRNSMPHFWADDLVELLPPSVRQPLARQKADFLKDREHRVSAGEFDSSRVDPEDFAYYWFVVNSRCFHFKPPGSRPGFMVLCPLIDYLNHGPTGSGCNIRQTPKGYEVDANRDYDVGEELLGTYGANPNEKLLVHYGFVCSNENGPSVDDDIRLDHVILPELDAKTQQQLQDVGYLGVYALVPATNEICFKTQVAVRAALLTANEWEYFITNGEDLSGDQSKKVERWLRPLMQKYVVEASEKIEEIEARKPEGHGPLTLLRDRWMQIRDGLNAYIRSI